MSDKIEQQADMVIQAAKYFLEKKLEEKLEDFKRSLKLDERLAAIEVGSGTAEQVKSLERRASRHGDHLARLESRVQALETGSPPAPLRLGDRSHDS